MDSAKQDATDRLTNVLGLRPVRVTGRQAGTVPAQVFRRAAELVGLTHRSRPVTTEQIIRMAGLAWRPTFDSRKSNSKGGGNVTAEGLWALGDALELLLGEGDSSAELVIAGDEVGWGVAVGQGRMADARRRQQIELAAQNWLMGYFESEGWAVEDTHLGNPYDAIATRGRKVLYLEAKGTTTRGARVIVTRNEVAWAREHPGACVLGVWAEMVFDDTGEILPSIGRQIVTDWLPRDEDLAPITYDYAVEW